MHSFRVLLKSLTIYVYRLEHIHQGTNNSHKTAISNNNDNSQITPAQRIEDREYYNDLPGKIPPDIVTINNGITNKMITPPMAAPRNKKPSINSTTATTSNNPQEEQINLIDLNDDLKPSLNSSACNSNLLNKNILPTDPRYVNCGTSETTAATTSIADKDPFDMRKCFIFIMYHHLIITWTFLNRTFQQCSCRSCIIHHYRSVIAKPAIHVGFTKTGLCS